MILILSLSKSFMIFHIHPTLSHPPLSPFTFARRRERGKPPPILTISGRKGFEEIFFGEWLDGKQVIIFWKGISGFLDIAIMYFISQLYLTLHLLYVIILVYSILQIFFLKIVFYFINLFRRKTAQKLKQVNIKANYFSFAFKLHDQKEDPLEIWF